jgi:hypothetical protein
LGLTDHALTGSDRLVCVITQELLGGQFQPSNKRPLLTKGWFTDLDHLSSTVDERAREAREQHESGMNINLRLVSKKTCSKSELTAQKTGRKMWSDFLSFCSLTKQTLSRGPRMGQIKRVQTYNSAY